MTKFGIGQPVPRLEDPRFITGRGHFVDDINLPRQLYGVVVMSPHAHARIKSIDTSRGQGRRGRPGRAHRRRCNRRQARQSRAGHARRHGRPQRLPDAPSHPQPRPGARGRRSCRFRRRRDAAQARDAAELVVVDYEVLPAVVDMEDAVKPGAPAVWDEAPDNIAVALMMGNKEATDAAFAKAKHVVSLKLDQQSRQRQLDRAARTHRRIPSRQRQLHALLDDAEPARHAPTSPATC